MTMSIRKILESLDASELVKEEYEDDVDLREFEEIMVQIKDLLEQAYDAIPRDSMISRRAESYWYSNMKGSIDGQSTMVSMQDTLNELRQEYSDDYDSDEW